MDTTNIIFKLMPDALYLRFMYYVHFKKKLNLKHPSTFNEKLQWLKLHDHDPKYIKMVDKSLAKEYVKGIIGDQYLIPTLRVWDSVDEIDITGLPERFVLKGNNDSGAIVICTDRSQFDLEKSKEFIRKRLRRNGYWYGREWPYKNVVSRILAEPYMEDYPGRGELTDYKIHCFDGKPKVIQVITDRFSEGGMINDHYSLDWEKLDLVRGHYSSNKKALERPEEIDEVLKLAEKLSQGRPYLRTDFYIVDHHVYFGELTFYPASGFNPFNPEKWDRIFGDWIKLPIDDHH